MMFPLLRRNSQQNTISSLYGMIVAQARLPCFYREYQVPDTVGGRFELLVMHLALVLTRLAGDPDGRGLGQVLFDHFCSDMDHNLREMGVGDLSVSKKMQGVGRSFYGRMSAYQKALVATKAPDAPDTSALVEAVARNIYDRQGADWPPAARLAAYMRETIRGLAEQATSDLLAGRVVLPNPTATVLADDEESLREGWI